MVTDKLFLLAHQGPSTLPWRSRTVHACDSEALADLPAAMHGGGTSHPNRQLWRIALESADNTHGNHSRPAAA